MMRICERTAKANTNIPQHRYTVGIDWTTIRPGMVIPFAGNGIDDLIAAQNAQNNNLAAQADFYTRLLKQAVKDEEFRMAQERKESVEIYSNVIEAKYGVKLCVSHKHDSDMTQMLLLVPNKLFADEQGKESLAEALHNIAMFILSME